MRQRLLKSTCRLLIASMLAGPAWASNPGFFETSINPGTDRSYLGFDVFAPLHSGQGQGLFIDARLNISDVERHSGSLGLNWRWLSPTGNNLLGVYGYVDRQRSPSDNYFNQASLGFEGYGKFWDWRMNGYFPWNGKQSTYNETVAGGGTFSQVGNQVIAPGSSVVRYYEQAMQGYDFEAGSRIPGLENLRLYLGAYYYDSPDVKAFTGWQGRLQWDISDRFTMGLVGRRDEWRGSEGFIELKYRVGFGGKDKSFQARKAAERMGERVRRYSEVVVSSDVAPDYNVTAPGPVLNTNGQPLNIYYVDNTASGSGTVEDPFATLAEAEAAAAPGDVIYVASGNGTSSGINQGVNLQPGQYLVGEGVALQLRDVSTAGPGIPVTRQDGSSVGSIVTLQPAGSAPQITNTSGVAVTLADNSHVSGVLIDGARVGIRALDVSGFTISDVVVNNGDQVGGACNALNPTVCTGMNVQVAATAGNTVDGVINNLVADRAELSVLALQASGGGTVNLQANALTLSNTTNDPNVDIDARDGNINFALSQSQLSGGNDGINADPILGASRVDVLLDSVTITGTRDDGVDMDAEQNSIASLTIRNSNINNARSRALELNARNDGRLDAVIENSRLADSATGNQDLLAFVTNNNSIGTLRVSNSTLENATRRSVLVSNQQDSRQTVTIEDSVLRSSGNDNIYVTNRTNAVLDFTLRDNQLLNSGAQAFESYDANNANARYNLTGNTLNGNSGTQVYQRSRNSADVVFNLDDNQLLNAGGRTLHMDNRGNSFDLDISNNTFDNSGNDHIYHVVRSGTDGSLDIVGNQILNAGQRGVNLNVSGAGINNAITLVDNTISGANNDGILASVQSGSVVTLDMTDNRILNAGDRSFEASLRGNNTELNVTAADNVFDGANTDNLYFITRSGRPVLNLSLTDNQILDAGQDGIEFYNRNRSTQNILLSGNLIQDSGARGIRNRADGRAIGDWRLINNQVLGSGNTGIELDVTGRANYGVTGQGNRITGGSGLGIDFDLQSTTASLDADSGGGARSSTGSNAIFGNAGREVRVNRAAVSAQSNWWGDALGLPPSEFTLVNGGSLDSSAFLTSDPGTP